MKLEKIRIGEDDFEMSLTFKTDREKETRVLF